MDRMAQPVGHAQARGTPYASTRTSGPDLGPWNTF